MAVNGDEIDNAVGEDAHGLAEVRARLEASLEFPRFFGHENGRTTVNKG